MHSHTCSGIHCWSASPSTSCSRCVMPRKSMQGQSHGSGLEPGDLTAWWSPQDNCFLCMGVHMATLDVQNLYGLPLRLQLFQNPEALSAQEAAPGSSMAATPMTLPKLSPNLQQPAQLVPQSAYGGVSEDA